MTRKDKSEFEAYCDYKGYVPQPGQTTIARESIDTLTPQRLWDKYISKRRPVVIQGFPQDPEWKAHRWTDLEHLRKQAGHVPVKIEPLHPTLKHFGTAAKRHTTDFDDFLNKLRNPKHKGKWYLTTQYQSDDEDEDDSDDDDEQEEDSSIDSSEASPPATLSNKRKRFDDSDEDEQFHDSAADLSSSTTSSADYDTGSSSSDDSIILNIPDPVLNSLPASFRPPPIDPVLPSPTHALIHEFPPQPHIMGNLVLQQTNLWMGNSSPEGKSSGLHHDFHDNLYALLAGRKRFLLFCPPAHDYLHPRGTVERVHQNGLIEYTPRDALHVDHPLSNRLTVRPDGLPPSEAARWRLMARRKAVEDAYQSAANRSGEGHIPTHRRKGKARMTGEQEAALRAYQDSIEQVVQLAQLEDEDEDADEDDDWSLPMSQEEDDNATTDSDGIHREAVFYDGNSADELDDDNDDSSSSDSDSESSELTDNETIDAHIEELIQRAMNGEQRATQVLKQLLKDTDSKDDDDDDTGNEESDSSSNSESDENSEDGTDHSISSSSDSGATSDSSDRLGHLGRLPRLIRFAARQANNGDEEKLAILDSLLEYDSNEEHEFNPDAEVIDTEDDEEITSESDSDDSDVSLSSDDSSRLDVPRRKGYNLPGGLRRDDGDDESDNEYDDMPGAELLLFDDADGDFPNDMEEDELAALAPGARRAYLEGADARVRDLSDVLDASDEDDSHDESDSDSDSVDEDDDDDDDDDDDEVVEDEDVELEDDVEPSAADTSSSSSSSDDSVIIEASDDSSIDEAEEEELKAAILAHLDAGGQIVVDDDEDDDDDVSDDELSDDGSSLLGTDDRVASPSSDSDDDSDDVVHDTDNLSKKEERQLKRALLRHLEAGGPFIDDGSESVDEEDQADLAAAQDSEDEEAVLRRMLAKHNKRHGRREDEDSEDSYDDEEDSDYEEDSADASMNTDEAEAVLKEMVDAGHVSSDDDSSDISDSDSESAESGSTESELFPREEAEDSEASDGSNWEADEDDLAEGEDYLAALAAAEGSDDQGLGKFAPSTERASDDDKEPLSFSKIDPSVLHAHFGVPDAVNGKFSKSKAKKVLKHALKPRKRCPEPLVVDLQPGEMLYLPASWWHEVTSASDSKSSSSSRKGDDVHMALNWWFHPPDNLTSSKRSARSARPFSSGNSSSTSNVYPLSNGFEEPYRDVEVWDMIRSKVEKALDAAREEQESYSDAMREFDDEIEREVRQAAGRASTKRARQSTTSSDSDSSGISEMSSGERLERWKEGNWDRPLSSSSFSSGSSGSSGYSSGERVDRWKEGKPYKKTRRY